ncbi:NAD(P)-binding Rossmann-fold superfamily protein [Rhynchospora pubera]|uniref:NAD(P)-binding Rossmann-fold superfamily protein n=1 Tax=Rhynchospora pubera TaxID=906938 RepID=A0AAV8FRV6_9POAL|nr:NAD(P)-binding Rossmann-fold superfamily protein [Rhynchospora pubera]
MATAQPSPLPLAGRTAIVTGASRGIGRGIACHLASLGADVIIGYSSNPSQAEALASELTTSRGIPVKADVSDPEAVQSLFDTAESAFGRPVHILVANAGVVDPKYPTLADTSVEDWDNTFAVNTRGAFLCCREAAKRVVRGVGGRIIVITSSLVGSPWPLFAAYTASKAAVEAMVKVVNTRGAFLCCREAARRLVRGSGGRIVVFSSSLVGSLQPGYSAYVASKAAVEAMVKILAKEMKGTRITANCVAPGPVATELFIAGKNEEAVKRIGEANPMGRIGEPSDIAPVVGFLCTDAAEWVNGQVIRLNGGAI